MVTSCTILRCVTFCAQSVFVWLFIARNKQKFLVYNPNKIHKTQSLFYLTTALHVSGVIITHLQEHKTTVTTTSGNH